jgi:hypothetical protein
VTSDQVALLHEAGAIVSEQLGGGRTFADIAAIGRAITALAEAAERLAEAPRRSRA